MNLIFYSILLGIFKIDFKTTVEFDSFAFEYSA